MSINRSALWVILVLLALTFPIGADMAFITMHEHAHQVIFESYGLNSTTHYNFLGIITGMLFLLLMATTTEAG